MEQRKLGKYDIRAILGRGAAGIVYEGWDPVIGRRVAIKTVRLPEDLDGEATEMLARCKRETQAAGRLNHPNIVGVFDYGETDEVAYIVMEFIDGRTLKTVLDSGEHLASAEILRVMIELLAGLQYTHGKGVVHRDIKPANIMLTAEGQVKITDFGIARIESSNLTQAGAMMGTPAYMSPEQFIGQTVDRRTDIYSVGVLLYQMVTGERPFDGSVSSIMHKALNVDPPRPSELLVTAPAALDAVVAKAMSRRPENRFDSADAFARALRDAFASSAAVGGGDAEAASYTRNPKKTIVVGRRSSASPASTAASAKAAPRRRFSGLIIAVCGLIALAAGGSTAWYLTRPPKQKLADPAQSTIAAATPSPAASDVAPIVQPEPTVAPPPREVTLTPPSTSPPASAQAAPLTTSPDPEATHAANEPEVRSPVPSHPLSLAEAHTLALGVPCALIDVSKAGVPSDPDRLRVFGPALPGGAFDDFLRQLRAGDRSLDLATERLGPAQCPALAMIAERVRASREQDALRLTTPTEPVSVGGRLAVAVQAVRDGALIVDIYAADGSVHHFLRRTVPSGTSGSEVTFAAPAPGPLGQNLLVAIVTPAPLDLSERPASESAGAYLPALRHALAPLPSGPSGLRAEIAIVSIAPAVRPAPSPGPASVASGHPHTPSLNTARCADIVGRVQLGETLSDADRTFLRTSCGP
jgi:eukaryotic-like serine/threonine-protein kinase